MYTAPLYKNYNAKDKPFSVEQQVAKGILVCPKNHSTLHFSQDKNGLISSKEQNYYKIVGGVPILLINLSESIRYAESSHQMVAEYNEFLGKSKKQLFKKWMMEFLNTSYQTHGSILAHQKTYVDEGQICLSIGGGPSRSHPKAVNVNISNFPNVDIVADAHHLPYAEHSIDSIICEDVLEHLKNPQQVVNEMMRILKPNGFIYSSVPFLIPYHGYPHHYQNFTLQGHEQLYLQAGFEISDKGACFGQLTTFLSYFGFMLAIYTPQFFYFNKFICRAWTVFSAIVKPLDRLFQKHPDAWKIACTTYVLVQKK